MTKPQKAGEPSMEEILASIRKIIADDPVSNRKSLGHEATAASAKPATPDLASSRKSALDDILGLADPASNMTTAGPAPAAPELAPPAGPAASAPRRPTGGDVPSWLFPAPVSASPPAGAPSRTPSPAAPAPHGVAKSAAQPVPSISIAPEPFFQPPAAKPAPDSAQKAASSAAPSAPVPPARGIDIGGIVPSRGEPAADSAPSDRKADPARIPDWMVRPSAPRAAPEEPAASLADTQPKPKASEPALSVAERVELAMERTEIVRPRTETEVSKPAPAVQMPAGGFDPAPQKPVMPESAAPSAQAERPLVSGGPAESPAPMQPAVHSNRVSSAAEAPISESRPAEKAQSMMPVPAPETAPAASRPAVIGARATKVAPSVEVLPTVLPGSSVRTLEDTVVDLLRPMIRQWLDDNMPRMVEKALRIELAESVKPKVDGKPKH